MKNFKKVISTVIALAISASTLVAVNAAKFSDVADTASYAEAIEVLTALGAISGYEDGTFQPEKEITRAEASTLIVGALNMKADAQAAAGSTQFVDVNEKASWASGYINVGVSEGYISGRTESQFDPQANVTYAEMCVMLTKITKYADYAASSKKDGDPWYKCYTDMAANIGLNKGANVPLTSALTRGTVAQMLYNAITTPILGVDKYIYAGNEYAPLNGEQGREFKTALSEKFNGYVVTAKVTDTAVAGSLDNDKAEVEIVKADFWNKTAKITEKTSVKNVNVTLKDVNVNDYYNQTGKAVILIDESDENHMIYFKSDARTEKKIVAADDYMMQIARGSKSYDSMPAGSRTIRFGSTEVKVEDPASLKLYVNGKQFATTVNDKVLDKFLGNAQGEITFVNTDDAKYKRFDAIFVKYYEIGQVASVTYRSGKTTVVLETVQDLFNAPATLVMTSAEIEVKDEDVEEGDTVVTVKKNGAEIELKDLAEDDIVAFATDFNGQYPTGKFGKTSTINTIDIIATDETISGMVVDYDDEEGTFTVGDKAYKFIGYDYNTNANLAITKTYDLELDPFGRIFNAGKQVGAIEKYAILEDIVGTDALLVLPDGSRATYEIDKNNTTWTDSTNFKVAEPMPYNRVISYKLKNDKITFSKKAHDDYFVGQTYSARLNKLAGIELTEKVNIIDASKYVNESSPSISDYAKFDASNFVAEAKYEAYTYEVGKFTSFIILVDTGYILTEESRFAVLAENIGTKFLNDESVYGAKALYNGEETTLYWETKPAGLDAGDAIFFTLDGDGYVKASYLVYDVSVNTSDYSKSTYAFKNISTALSGEYDTALWSLAGTLPVPAGYDAALVEGVVMESDSDQILFGMPDGSNVIDMAKRNVVGGYADFDLADDCAIYTFTKSDANLLAKERFNVAVGAQIGDSSTYFKKVTGQEDQYKYVAADEIRAVALVIDKEIVAIYAIN